MLAVETPVALLAGADPCALEDVWVLGACDDALAAKVAVVGAEGVVCLDLDAEVGDIRVRHKKHGQPARDRKERRRDKRARECAHQRASRPVSGLVDKEVVPPALELHHLEKERQKRIRLAPRQHPPAPLEVGIRPVSVGQEHRGCVGGNDIRAWGVCCRRMPRRGEGGGERSVPPRVRGEGEEREQGEGEGEGGVHTPL